MQTLKTLIQMQTFEQAVEKVVNWWAEKSFQTPLNQNNGDTSINGGMGFMLMNIVAGHAQKDATPEKIQLFKDELTRYLLSDTAERYYKNTLSVDYAGDSPLIDACNFAGLSDRCLPIKSCTWIRTYGDNADNQVTASLGYGGERIVL